MLWTHYDNQLRTYDGSQLSPHWIYHHYGQVGNAIVGFCGPAHVSLDAMVDQVDVKNQEPIAADLMLHFLLELFDASSLNEAILWQRLAVCIWQDILREHGVPLKRKGDDLFYQDRKLSVSIATQSMVSHLVHLGINVKRTGAPLPIASLDELSVSVDLAAMDFLDRFREELQSVYLARCKVRGV